MKRIAIAVVMVLLAFSGSAFAANSLHQGAFGISVGMGDSVFSHSAIPNANVAINNVVDLQARFLAAKNLALYGNFGFQNDGGDADATYISLGIGARMYLKTDDFAPFVAGQLSYVSVKSDPKVADISVIDVAGLFGAEYFVGKQFSLEGSVGVGIGQAKDDLSKVKDTYFGTRTVGVRANFYF